MSNNSFAFPKSNVLTIPEPSGSIVRSQRFLLWVELVLIAIIKLLSITVRKFLASNSSQRKLQCTPMRKSHLFLIGFVGRLSIIPPSTYKDPLSCIGLKTAGTQQEASNRGISSPSVKYSALP